jgi:hypothetical protein
LGWLWGAYRLAINRLWGGFDVALRWLWAALAVRQTFLSANEADFPVRWIEGGGDWKVATTGRLESLP